MQNSPGYTGSVNKFLALFEFVPIQGHKAIIELKNQTKEARTEKRAEKWKAAEEEEELVKVGQLATI